MKKPLDLQIPDDFLDRAMALQEQSPEGGCLWMQRGNLVAEVANGLLGARKMIVYQKCSDIWACAVSTVREDYKNASELGDWVDEMPFHVSREHVRLARAESRIREVDTLVVLQERANESDRHGGQLCPPRVWREKIKDLAQGKKTDDGEDVLGRLHAAYSAVTTALKRANGKAAFAHVLADIEAAGCVLADLVDKALEAMHE